MSDPADIAQQDIEHAETVAIANAKRLEVEPTDDCVECGNEISEGRKKAIKTNLCIGCAEVNELQSRHFVTRR
ncbi:TraR/DksA C4-type zinc finger protein [Pseudoalteromonas phage vB_Pun_Y3]